MGIQVECPHGHTFKVKDKYAGKRGLCPHCKDQTIVEVPEISKVISEAVRKAAADEKRAAQVGSSAGDSIFDDEPHEQTSETSGSLLGSSVIQHNVRCEFCNESVPMWFAKCPTCGHFMEAR
ncbi:MAG: hypothetical protein ACR2NU_07735 [Aeoliella sp.]